MLTPAAREKLSACIYDRAVAVGIGSASNGFIDSRGLTAARQLAMKLAVEKLSTRPQFLLIDFVKLPGVDVLQKGVVDGDSLCFSIAAASIVAKVARDRMMTDLDGAFPGYGLARHKGYGTGEHLACLKRLGPCELHRRSFQPVREAGGV